MKFSKILVVMLIFLVCVSFVMASPVNSVGAKGSDSKTTKEVVTYQPKEVKECKNLEMCKQIDEVWGKIGGNKKVWTSSGWKTFQEHYFTKVIKKVVEKKSSAGKKDKPATSKPTAPTGPDYDEEDEGEELDKDFVPQGDNLDALRKALAGCPTTKATKNSEAIGKSNNGKLKNAVHLVKTDENKKFLRIRNSKQTYGTIEMVNIIEYAGCYINKKYGGRLEVGDLSEPKGGDIAKHVSHENGIDVDFGFYVLDKGVYKNLFGEQGKMCHRPGSDTSCYKPGHDKHWINPKYKAAIDVNWEFLKVMFVSYDVKKVVLDEQIINLLRDYAKKKDPQNWKKYGKLLRKWSGHHDHYHVRIKCPKDDKGCNAKHDGRAKKTKVWP